MSGLEALGALSGAAQLVDIGFQIIEFLSNLCVKLHAAPASMRKRLIQVQHLTEIAGLIQENSSLQTTLIGSLLANCKDKANELRKILLNATAKLEAGKAEKYLKALEGVIKEKRVLELFQALEQEKSALILCIASIDS